MMPWVFALDRTHYSRWLSVHLKDMLELKDKHPVVQKTPNLFSTIALDQAHE